MYSEYSGGQNQVSGQVGDQSEIVRILTGIYERLDAARNPAGWIDAKSAAEYLGCSRATFDSYRYKEVPRLTGYRVGSKTLYKRDEIDAWVKLYELRKKGLA